MITPLIAVNSVCGGVSTIVKMFKFDFVHGESEEQTRTAQNETDEPPEPVLTEISLIELVCAACVKPIEDCNIDLLHSWTLCPPLFPSPRCKYRH